MIAFFNSGGKDCKLAYELSGLKADIVITLVENGKTWNHGTEPIGIPVEVNGNFLEAIERVVKEHKITKGIFGLINPVPDIYRIFRRNQAELITPLLKWDRKKVIDEILKRGIKATIVSGEFKGEVITKEFINKHPDIDICGEKGEYHTNAE